ncbi:heme lyase CcmF/NrfE family subunit [Aquabacterium sp. A7-Y]|uniref:heme lyase CcmF/NrfE family subunit n=1 Tax=Aquabacterium sp. A7-Y TaxID=1349605 RepID=UPI00223D7E9B|nr:heme lyase CcmF/NrfE family subunit [Aquabacterium sp. A7-Y]MCW7537911.1 heme lyase CcmF/NrfE family subunit [Aquabacterium sp. A7-Y]
MIPELGHFALILALCVGLTLGLLPMLSRPHDAALSLSVARRAAALLFALTLLAAAALAWSFAVHDFSVRYVASHSHSTLPLAYRLAALWGSHEGSMLLWLLTLAGWTAAVALRVPGLPAPMAGRVLGVLGWISVGLLLFVLGSSNPFLRLMPAAADGRDLNALLQDPGMVFHPPALYLGYVGFAVPFAFAVAALWSGQLPPAWLRWLRPWVLSAWAALTLGIVLGSSWAYRVLGWGGWWFWDPVENASLLPWLAGLALLHALAAAEAREHFKRWVLLLAIGCFGLSLIGTFIVRSGAITSVHAFATDPRRGVFILALLGASLGSALWLYAARAPRIGGGRPFALVSREALLLSNTLLFSVATASVLLATLYPMALDALGLGKISVGPPYFEAVLLPLLAPAVFLMGVGPLARWQGSRLPELTRRLRWAVLASVATALLAMALGRPGGLLGIGFFLAAWVLCTVPLGWLKQPAGPRSLRFWGMQLAHLGVGVFILGVTVVKGFQIEREVPLAVGQVAQVGAYRLRLDALESFQAHNHGGARAHLTLMHGGEVLAVLKPESRRYRAQDMTVSVPAIASSAWRDIYVAMGEPVGPRAWGLRLQYKPMILWVWGGFVLMSVGAVLAACDRRYRAREPESPRRAVRAAGCSG